MQKVWNAKKSDLRGPKYWLSNSIASNGDSMSSYLSVNNSNIWMQSLPTVSLRHYVAVAQGHYVSVSPRSISCRGYPPALRVSKGSLCDSTRLFYPPP